MASAATSPLSTPMQHHIPSPAPKTAERPERSACTLSVRAKHVSTMAVPNPLCARAAEGSPSRPVPATSTYTSHGSPDNDARDVSRGGVNDDNVNVQQVLHVRCDLAREPAMHV